MRHETGTHRGLWGCLDAPTGSLSPEQDNEPRQASLVGTDGRIPGRGRRAGQAPSGHKPHAPCQQCNSPEHSQTRLTDRQAQEDSPHSTPYHAQVLAAPTSIPVCTALHLRQQTSYLYLSQKGAGASKPLPASCSWQHSNYFLSWVLPATGTLAGTT